MKKNGNRALLALLFVVLFSSCTKEDFCPANAQPKNLRLKEMIWGERSYTFYYNQHNDVDSVRAEDKSDHYTYRVYYTGRHIDSVALIDGGVALSTHTQFTYNGDKITGYTYHWYTDPPAFVNRTTFTYDSKGRMATATRDGAPLLNITYGDSNNIRTMIFAGNTYIYTQYDSKLNPLYYVHNLFAIFTEESAIWQDEFSQHNTAGPGIVNQYNALDQLVKKTVDPPGGPLGDNFLFSYYP